MIDEAAAQGLKINVSMKNHLVLGMPRPGATNQYVAPNAAAELHQSLTWAWRLIEWIPKRARYEEWPQRLKFAGWYIPCGEPRLIDDPPKPPATPSPVAPRIHQSVLERMKLVPDYKPVNFPRHYDLEAWPYGEGPDAQGEGSIPPPVA